MTSVKIVVAGGFGSCWASGTGSFSRERSSRYFFRSAVTRPAVVVSGTLSVPFSMALWAFVI